MEKDKVCLTTFIYGERYQAYIPFLVYSCHVSYPDYDIILFVHGDLCESVQRSLNLLSVENCRVIEHCYDDCPQMTPLKSMALRWILWDDCFMDYDYLYVVDIDMIYQKENIPLHEQHKIHMQTTGLAFDNMKRKYIRHPFQLIPLLQRIKYAGMTSFLKFLFGEKVVYRASGLHFVKVKDYYEKFTPIVRQKYKESIYYNKWLKDVMFPDNEALLYYILQKLGFSPEKLPIQSNSYSSINFEEPERTEFRPHHGIHLGIFRTDIPLSQRPSDEAILRTEAYKYYFAQFKKQMYSDPMFRKLLNEAPVYIKDSFKRMFKYAYNEK